MLETASDKAGWLAKSSSSYYPNRPASIVIDGKRDDTGQNFATGGNQPHSWLQIDMGEERWVKGGRMVTLHWQRQYYIEVRVGDQDVEGAPEDEMLCQNHLCYMSDNDVSVS